VDSAYDLLNQMLGERIEVSDLKPHASIDVCDLANECARQPHIFALACRIYVDARDQLRRDEAQLHLIRAEIASAIRSNPEQFGIGGKLTVDAVNCALDQHEDVKAASEIVRVSQKQVDAARVLVDIFDQKRSMLNNEVALFSAQYYGTNPPGTNRTSEAQKTEEEIAQLRKENSKG